MTHLKLYAVTFEETLM